MENNETQAVQQKTPLTKQEKIKRILLIVLSVAVALVIIFGFIFGSPYSIKKNNYSSFEAMIAENYDKPTVLMMAKKSCPYCQKVYPILSELKDSYEDSVNFYYIDIHDGGEGTELYREYRARIRNQTSSSTADGVPAVLYFYARTSADDSMVLYNLVVGYSTSSGKNTKSQIEGYIQYLLNYQAA